jgi:hypothetical protein
MRLIAQVTLIVHGVTRLPTGPSIQLILLSVLAIDRRHPRNGWTWRLDYRRPSLRQEAHQDSGRLNPEVQYPEATCAVLGALSYAPKVEALDRSICLNNKTTF